MEYTIKTSLSPQFNEDYLEKTCLRNKTINYIKHDCCISKYLKKGDYWESWMFKYIQENYIENTNIIDLGAHIGTTSLMMSEVLSDNCNIFAFEPLFNDILLKNVLDNNLNNKIIIYPHGVGNEIKKMKIKPFHLTDNRNFGAVSLLHNREDKPDSIEINIAPLDYFDFKNISLMKIDVEHMEIEVLEGCLNLIKKYKPTILIETYQLEKLKKERIFEELTKLGYTIDIIPEGYSDYIMKIKNSLEG